jgi:hypothetical protein
MYMYSCPEGIACDRGRGRIDGGERERGREGGMEESSGELSRMRGSEERDGGRARRATT